jgi:hypothetical protein
MSESGKLHAGWMTILLFLLAVLTGTAVLLVKYSLKKSKIDLEKSIAYLKSEYTFAQIGILSRSNGSISFNLKFLNVDGSSITDRYFQLKGDDIFIESKVVTIDYGKTNRALVFPFNLYTDVIPPSEGELLSGLYVSKGFPEIYMQNVPGVQYEQAVRYLYLAAFENRSNLENDMTVRIMDASLHQGQFRHFEEGRNYLCQVHPDGGLELSEVK